MTEDEKKNLREHFLEPETRCDTYISSEMKAVWRCQISILEEIDRICATYGLTYSLAFGSLLGAIRHKGYIPWDDDIDVCMPRHDYKKFVRIAQGELPENLFLQTSLTDPEYDLGFAKIRDSRTSAIESMYTNGNYHLNQGIFVDIFPVDGCLGKFTATLQERLASLLSSIRRRRYLRIFTGTMDELKHIIAFILFFILGGSRGVYLLQERVLALVKLTKTGSCGVFGVCKGDHSFDYWPQNMFENCVTVPFEYINVKVPRDYVDVLNYTFGDWHKLIRGGGDHAFSFVSTDIPYFEAVRNKLWETGIKGRMI